MKKQYEGSGTNVFSMRPLQTCWHLDRECTVEIWRKGFPLVPNFSSTIDSATGQTLHAAVPDLGDEYCPPSHTGAMKGYIALSRVREADGLLIAQPFSPLLFNMGAQPWPTLLFDVQRGRVSVGDLHERCEQAMRASKETKLLKDAFWQ